MKFRTQFDERTRFVTQSGQDEYPEYKLDSDGKPIVVGTHNRYDEIQSHRASVELSTLLQRYANGDESALNQNNGFFGDVTDAPSNLQEWFDRYKQASADFDGLPPGLKELFNNNPAEFWTTFGTTEFNEILTKYRETISKQGNGGANGSGNDPAEPDN